MDVLFCRYARRQTQRHGHHNTPLPYWGDCEVNMRKSERGWLVYRVGRVVVCDEQVGHGEQCRVHDSRADGQHDDSNATAGPK